MIQDFSHLKDLGINILFKNTTYVYELIDPRNNKVAYIGITNDLKERFSGHLYNESSNPKKFNWIKKLRALNLKPTMRIIATTSTRDQAEEIEIRTIKAYGLSNLKNLTPGGGSISFSRRVSVVGLNILTGAKIRYSYMMEAKKDGFSFTNISACVKKEKASHKGFIWVKASEEFSLESLLNTYLTKDRREKQRKPILGVNVFTSNTIRFNSHEELRKSKTFFYKRVIKAIKNNAVYLDRLWSFDVPKI